MFTCKVATRGDHPISGRMEAVVISGREVHDTEEEAVSRGEIFPVLCLGGGLGGGGRIILGMLRGCCFTVEHATKRIRNAIDVGKLGFIDNFVRIVFGAGFLGGRRRCSDSSKQIVQVVGDTLDLLDLAAFHDTKVKNTAVGRADLNE